MSLEIHDLGLIPYPEAYAMQKSAVDSVLRGGQEQLLLCEHPAVITLGRLAKPANVLLSREKLGLKNIPIIPLDRGGDVTLHAPGQLVAYPILDLKAHGKDVRHYLSKLEEVAIDFLGSFDILASRFPGRTGVWVESKKIVSLGVGVRKWVCFHGAGINLNTDLELFKLIRPCGMDVAMASVQSLTGRPVDIQSAKKNFTKIFIKHFHSE